MKERNTPQNGAENRPIWRERLPVIAIWARYLLPVLCGVMLIVVGMFYSVSVVSLGVRQKYSPLRTCINTLFGAREYLTTLYGANQTSRYILHTVASIGVILAFLLAVFFAGLAAYTAVVAFRRSTPLSVKNQKKLIFKIVFPNRVMLFLSGLVYLIPAAYLNIYAAIEQRYMALGGEATIFIRYSVPLIATAACEAVILLLSLYISRHERQLGMDLFTLEEQA